MSSQSHLPFLAALALSGLLAACSPAPVPPPAPHKVAAPATRATVSAPAVTTACLLPLGQPDSRLLAPIARAVALTYDLRVRQLEPLALPKSAWYPPRKRYRADRLLDFLQARRRPRGCDFLLGFTQADVSTTKGDVADWGVLGLADTQQGVAVVSTFRMRGNATKELLLQRAVKVSLHELGHAIGLPHRNEGPGCLMNDAHGAVASIDRARGALCEGERQLAEAYLHRALPRRQDPDWRAIEK